MDAFALALAARYQQCRRRCRPRLGVVDLVCLARVEIHAAEVGVREEALVAGVVGIVGEEETVEEARRVGLESCYAEEAVEILLLGDEIHLLAAAVARGNL